jgi:oligopeptide transport system substrate-binding protein
MKRFLVPSLLAVLAAIIGSACSKPEQAVEKATRDQVLLMGNHSEPRDLDPQIVSSQQEYFLTMSMFEGLTSPDPKDLHPMPGVAEKWEMSDDLTVFTFHLRKNAKWSNGDPVTAKDFLYAFQRILSPKLGAEYAYMHWVVVNAKDFNEGKLADFSKVGYEAPDDHTLRIRLTGPTPYFPFMVSHQSWFPVHKATIEKFGKMDDRGTAWTRPENLVGNGPFRLKEWKPNQIIAVEKSATYWDASIVRLKEIHFFPIDNQDTEERAFRAGQMHVTASVPTTKIDTYRRENPELLIQAPFYGTYFFRINVTNGVLKDVRVRKALALSVDREAMVKTVARGGQLPAYNLTPPGTAGYTCRTQLRYDVPAAQKLLAEAGFPDGRGFPKLELLFNTDDGHKKISEALQQMWKKNLGIDISLVNQESKVWDDTMKQLNYQIARYAWIGDYLDPNSFLDMFLTGGGNNQTAWSNPEYDRLIAEAGRTSDSTKRLEIFQQAEAILMNEVPIVPLYFYTRLNLKRPEVKGWHHNILDIHPYKFVYLEAGK